MIAVRVAVAAFACIVAASASAQAQALRSLHVTALSMRADRTRVQVGQVFHLAIHVHVRENVGALDELVIPDVGTMQLLGDERAITHGGGGSDAVETLTLEPSRSGVFTFRPAYLDAIDANTGRPSRFSSNAVRVDVLAASADASGAYADAARRALQALLWLVVASLLLIGTIAVVRLRRARGRSVTHAASPETLSPAPPVPARSARDEVAGALRVYRTSPAGPALQQLRAALYAAAGTNGGSTLADALRATPDASLRRALVAAERAAFGPPRERDDASRDVTSATEAWLR